MADKKNLRSGVANLISGADRSVAQKESLHRRTEEQPITDEATPEQQTESAAPQMEREPTTLQDERDLLNSIEDEDFRRELEERLYRRKLVGRGRPRKNDLLGRRMDGYNRTSLIIPVKKWEKIKEIALIETLTLKEIVELALDMVIERYESKYGEIKPHTTKKRNINDIF